MEAPSNGDYAAWEDGFRLTDDETLAGALARYDEVAARTDSLVEAVDQPELRGRADAAALLP